jgi:tRNA (adenine57-N1/adenine58-N1)-methyltransferase
MIAHTGFLISARRLAPGTILPKFRVKTGSKAEGTEADMEAWLPQAIGQRPLSEKKLRKTVRRVQNEANQREN